MDDVSPPSTLTAPLRLFRMLLYDHTKYLERKLNLILHLFHIRRILYNDRTAALVDNAKCLQEIVVCDEANKRMNVYRKVCIHF